jgi:hypothetical protein
MFILLFVLAVALFVLLRISGVDRQTTTSVSIELVALAALAIWVPATVSDVLRRRRSGKSLLPIAWRGTDLRWRWPKVVRSVVLSGILIASAVWVTCAHVRSLVPYLPGKAAVRSAQLIAVYKMLRSSTCSHFISLRFSAREVSLICADSIWQSSLEDLHQTSLPVPVNVSTISNVVGIAVTRVSLAQPME